jgi:hypothetical protein
MVSIPDWLSWQNAGVLLNSAFTTSLFGALAGAYAGARAAQRITERAKDRDQLLSQIRTTNAATMVAFSASNVALAVKKQHVQSMYEEFARAKADLEAFRQQRATGQRQGNAEYRFVADMRTFTAPSVPIETLKDLVFHRVSAYGRPLALVTVLEQSFAGLKEMIAKRDVLIHRFASGDVPKELLPNYYFGMPLPSGDTNQEYPDLVEGIRSYVDDTIFFSSLLCADLIAHGDRAHASFTKRFGKGAPRVSTADFAGPRKQGLIPPDEQYADWLKAFSEQRTEANEK